MIESLIFAQRLAASLRQGVTESIDHVWYVVRGRLDTGPLIVQIEVWVWKDFSKLKQIPPQAWCKKSWMRNHPDWHNSDKTGMCWVLEAEWRDMMDRAGKPVNEVLDDGVRWLLDGVSSLINRHYVGEVEKMKEWPKKWLAWGHNEQGYKEYERQKRMERARDQTHPNGKSAERHSRHADPERPAETDAIR